MKWWAQRNKDLEEFRDITDDVIESDFVPYACHYNAHTLLTKNGELLQTIKIVGFAYESVNGTMADLREVIRSSVLNHVPSDKFAFWFHTIRRKTDLTMPGEYAKHSFAQAVHEAWNQQNHWDETFTNEVYITVVIEGQTTDIHNPRDFFRALWPKREFAHRRAFLTRSAQALEEVVQGMLKELAPFGAVRLGVEERDGIFYSEPCQFLGKIINLSDEAMPLTDEDLSQYLTTQELTFGFNAMEVRSQQGKRRFGCVLTLKEYRELSASAVDKFLHLPIEFIVTQCLDFINYDQALKEYEYQNELISISGDKELARISGLEDVMQSHRHKIIDFGEQQLSVFIQADNLKALEQYTERATAVLGQLGVVSVREDVKFEECYWAQLPGNFEFVKRLKPINTRRVGGFTNVSNVPAGIASQNHWGDAITVFHTAAHTPYYFNFHLGDNGHSWLVGPPGAGKTVLLHFLLSEAQKFKPRLVVFDAERSSELFVRSLGGEYHTISETESSWQANPLALAGSENTLRFLTLWLACALHLDLTTVQENEHKALRGAVEHALSLAENAATPSPLSPMARLQEGLRTTWPEMASALDYWHRCAGNPFNIPSELSNAFSEDGKAKTEEPRIVGYRIAAGEDGRLRVPVMAYMLHTLVASLDGTPTIVVFHDAWDMLNHPFYAMKLEGFLNALRKNNALAIFTTEQPEKVAASMAHPIITKHAATRIFMPDPQAMPSYQRSFGLTEREYLFLGLMSQEERHFLLKRGDEAIVAELRLHRLPDILGILGCHPDYTARMQALREARGPKPEDWLSPLREEVAA